MEGDLIIFFYAWFVVWHVHGMMKELWLSHVRRKGVAQASINALGEYSNGDSRI